MPYQVLHIISGDLWGGAEAQVLLQLSSLKALGHFQPQLLLFNEGKPAQNYREQGLPVFVCDERRGTLRCLFRAIRQAQKVRPEIIVAHGYKETLVAWLAAAFSGAALIVTFHGLQEHHRGLRNFKYYCYLRIQRIVAALFASRIVCVSETLAEQLGYAQKKKLSVVGNCAQLEPFDPAKNPFSAKPAILIAGRLAAIKRVDLALQAFDSSHQTHDAHLYIAGSGEQEEELKTQAQSLASASRIHFLGFRSDISQIVQHADLVLLTSDSEGTPTIVLEAVAAIKSLACSALPGVEEIFKQLPRYPLVTFKPGDAHGAARAISEALEQRVPAAEIQQINSAFSDHFSPSSIAKQLSALYLKII